ncbi:MAG: flagellar type III secretion system pore protein FliP [Candidatus Krumholzibacteriia bacterium]
MRDEERRTARPYRRRTAAAAALVATLSVLVLLLAAPGIAAQEAAPQTAPVTGDPPERPTLTLRIDGADTPEGVDAALKIVLLMTVLSVAPALLVLLTSFTRIVIVLGFLRQAIGTQQAPNNQIIIGLSLFLTLVIMSPVLQRVNADALQPFLADELTQQEALTRAQAPLKEFMLGQVREKDVALFLDLTATEAPAAPEELPMLVVIPSFVIGELKTAFQMGFVLFLPFLIIDMVVASVLMSMGMMMLPPVLISLPFKILLFVLVDGWFLVVRSLVQAFQ